MKIELPEVTDQEIEIRRGDVRIIVDEYGVVVVNSQKKTVIDQTWDDLEWEPAY